ncbi:hypothetical protein Esi_0327_0036 [Ectocarpus siliculosus]|uniref:Uncharacterized protein n=1 Tax=Ectocarpus siliculosus TaxID=2880 RepID=D7FXG8_ECTSI|nr:hypothetical protein Esi_0327_0036 [Ectocarpus siliculosus]|eukprot:CBJ32305.1 hypothetical protein Esi_0327_0036 [Ectocarpus siliculosus]
MALAPSLEKKRRMEGRFAVAQQHQEAPPPSPDLAGSCGGAGAGGAGGGGKEDVEAATGVDLGCFRAQKQQQRQEVETKRKEEVVAADVAVDGWGPRQDTGPVEGGWGDCCIPAVAAAVDEENASASSSSAGTASSVERGQAADEIGGGGGGGGWEATESSTSSSEEAGGWGMASGGGGGGGASSVCGVSESGSSSSSMAVSTDEQGEEGQEEARWAEELKSSVGVVTDLVLPCQGRDGAGVDGVGIAIEEGGEEEEGGEDEREMAAALEAIYEKGREQLKRHAEVHGKEARQRATDAWLASRTPQQQSDYRERTQPRTARRQHQQHQLQQR